MSLYLKYRPKSFADVVGQEHIVTTLEHAVDRDQLVHAYLFFGPRGTGKTSVARILAKILLIRGIEDENTQKQVIKSVDDGTLVDLIEIDAASNRGIDDVRDLKEKVQFTPSLASAKVYIVDEVHMMTKEAFNALLKTLEEPPPHAYFILATTELHKVPDTIQSRCQRFPFYQIGDDDIVRCLQNIADKERITIDRGALRAIARHVNGGMRDAISLLDQLSSLSKITEEDVRVRIGESAEEYVEKLWEYLDAGDRRGALGIASTMQEKGVSLEVFLRQLLSKARSDLHSRIEEKLDVKDTLERIDSIFRALKDLRVSPVPSVALEVAVVEMCDTCLGSTFGSKSGAKARKKREKKADKADKTDKVEKVEKVEKAEATVVAKELNMEELLSSWTDIISAVKTASVRMSLKDAIIESLDEDCITLGFSSNFHRKKVEETAACREVEDVIKDNFHHVVSLKCILQGEGSESSALRQQDEEEVNVVEAVAEIFGK